MASIQTIESGLPNPAKLFEYGMKLKGHADRKDHSAQGLCHTPSGHLCTQCARRNFENVLVSKLQNDMWQGTISEAEPTAGDLSL